MGVMSAKRRIPLRTKLTFANLIASACVVLLSLAASRHLLMRFSAEDAARDDVLLLTERLSALRSSASEELFSYMLTGDVHERDQAFTEFRTIHVTTATLATRELTPTERANLDAAASSLAAMERAATSLTPSSPFDLIAYARFETSMDEAAAKIETLNAEARTSSMAIARSAHTRTDALILVIGLCSVIFGVVAGHVSGRALTAPLMALRDAVARFGAGDLDATIPPAPNDEIGDLVRAFESMARGTRENLAIIAQDQAELRQAQKLEAIGRLAAGVAHELNTPMQFIGDSLSFIDDVWPDVSAVLNGYRDAAHETAGMTADAADEQARRRDIAFVEEELPLAIARVREGIVRITTITRAMKDLSHPSVQETAPNDLNRLVLSTLAVARHEYKYVADVVTDLGELPPITCAAGELSQALLNLVVNAAHAIADSGAHGTITVRTRRDRDEVVLSVSDTGGGISDEIRDKIFDPFFTTKGVGRGTGQGLAIVRSVAERHHGSVTFETATGKGTTFRLAIPVAPTIADRAAA